jgi:peptide-methionine (S)-S-oxide reductase
VKEGSEDEEEEKKVSKLKKMQEMAEKLGKARKANAVTRWMGYDHLEGQDFDAAQDSIDREYLRQHRSEEIATLGGGCFWCTEAIFKELNGVKKVESGYSGGTFENPSWEEVCGGNTGHAEVVQITFDPKEISFKQLLKVFFTIHDPTTLNRQGADVGTEYRSVIFYHSSEQKRVAEEVMKKISDAKIWDNPLVTQLMQFKVFYRAEDHHQDYFKKNPSQSYCTIVIAPKVSKFRKEFLSLLKR